MEYVLEHIRQVCNAKDIRLVIRKEDKTDKDFILSTLFYYPNVILSIWYLNKM